MSIKELEEHLKNFAYAGRRQNNESTKNVAHEVISGIIDLNHGGKGILTDITKFLKVSNNPNIFVESSFKDSNMISGTVYIPHNEYPDFKTEGIKLKSSGNSSFSTQGNFYRDGAEGDDTPINKSNAASQINKSYDRSYLSHAVGKVIFDSRK